MIFWLDLIVFLATFGLLVFWKNKEFRKLLMIVLGIDILILFWITRTGVALHVYQALLYWSPLAILFLFPYYGYKNNWMKAKKSSFSLALLIVIGLILFFIYSDVVVSKLSIL